MWMNRRWVGRLTVPLVTIVTIGTLTAVPASSVVGDPAVDQAYRFLAKVQVGTAGDVSRSCTGVLVAPQWVITAKACFAEAGAPPAAGRPPRPSQAIVGRLDLTGTAGYSAAVTTLVPHPTQDVVLAKLAIRIPDITPVALATSPAAVGEALQVAGFGRTRTEWVPNTPHVAGFTVQAVTDSQLTVAGATAGASICKGDAGGPALRVVGGQNQLLAVSSTSWQGGCLANESETRAGGVQTRVDTLAGWIRDTVTEPAQISAIHNPVSGAQEVYVIGTNGHLYERHWRSGAGWSVWADLGGSVIGTPAVVSNPVAKTQEVYAVGTNGHLWEAWTSGSGWKWSDLGGTLSGSPAAVYNPILGAQEVFAVGTNGHLFRRYWQSGHGWSAWSDLEGSLAGSPAAVYNPVGSLEVYATATDGHLLQRWTGGSEWSRWTDLGGVLPGRPTVLHSPTLNTQEVFAVGANAHLLRQFWQSGRGWSGWSDLGGSLTGTPAPVHDPLANSLEVYAIGSNGHVFERWTGGSSWSAWSDLGGSSLTGSPAPVNNPVVKTQEVYAIGTNGHVYETYWSPNVPWHSWVDLGAPS
jgi:Trypsin